MTGMLTDTTSAGPAASRYPRSDAPRGVTRRVDRPLPRWWRDASVVVFWSILLVVTALWVAGGGIQDFSSVAGALTSSGRLTGLIASALLLIQVVLMARVPWIEQAWGQDALARGHRIVGFTSFNLMLAHIGLIIAGYAAASPLGLWGTTLDMILNYPGMLLALAGTLALVMVVVTSLRRARRRLRYESWHLLHLYAYLGAGLALPHQLWTGAQFLDSRAATIWWWSLWGVSAALVLGFRVALPAYRSLRHPIRVSRVQHETEGVVSVTVSGRGLASLPTRSGQFFQFRFLDGPGWTRGNPYSISAAPDGLNLRFTAEVVGDSTAKLTVLRPGTRVLIEGPYGILHSGVRTKRKVLLIGAGIGITPMRALFEDLPAGPGDLTLVQRVRSRDDAIFADELGAIAAARGANYVVVEGRRIPGRHTWLPAQAAHLSDAQALISLAPDLRERDIFVCGSGPWMEAVRSGALAAGVPENQIHLEHFAY